MPSSSFVQAGPGLYRDNSGSTDASGNIAAGILFQLHPKFGVEAGADLHGVNRADWVWFAFELAAEGGEFAGAEVAGGAAQHVGGSLEAGCVAAGGGFFEPSLGIHAVLELGHAGGEGDAEGAMVVAGVLDGREGVEELPGDGGGGGGRGGVVGG